MNDLEKIELYLGGNMTQEERLDFEEKVKSNPSLEQKLHLQNAINHHLGNKAFTADNHGSPYYNKIKKVVNNEESHKIRETIRQVNNQYINDKKNKTPIRLYVLSIAAVIAILFFGFNFLLQNQSNDGLYAQYYNENDLPSFVQRSDNDTIEISLEKAVALYKQENYSGTLKELSLYHQNNSKNKISRVYSAFSYAYLNDYKNAISELDVLENSNSLDADKAFWFKALIYLKAEDRENAKIQLEKITSSKSNYKYSKAKQILEDL